MLTFLKKKDTTGAYSGPDGDKRAISRSLPPGVRLFSFDGEVVYRGKNGNPFDGRIFSLMPISDDPALYARRYQGGQHMQEVYMPIENFHGHATTVFYFYMPEKDTARTGNYRAESFAAMSMATQQWIWNRTKSKGGYS